MAIDQTYTNWDKERDGVIDETLNQLKGQENDQQAAQYQGKVDFSAQIFLHAKTFVQGPIIFEAPFAKEPQLTFGQRIGNPDAYSVSTPQASAPLIVTPFVRSFVYTNGQVDGFYLGLYAITTPPSGAATHTVYWNASGEGSANQQNLQAESWTESYDHNEPDFLTEQAGSTDDY